MLQLLVCVLALATMGPGNGAGDPAGDPERREPSATAPAHQAFAWTAKSGLRFTWCLPEGYSADKPRNLTLICHGTGLDYRWGHWNNPPGVFRPDDVVVSVDGPTPNADTRLFLGEPKDALAIRDFLREMRSSFAVDRVYLYGHSQGGFFVVYFAGEYPSEVAGVVAHASGAWNWSKTEKPVREVAISFMHGTRDPVVPYGQSVGSRDFYEKTGFDRLHLRRLQFYNHWPNAVRATEELDWCEGVTTSNPSRALELAREILRPKPADEYQWKTAVGFSGARDILRRFEDKASRGFGAPDPALAAQAKEIADQIEEEGARHVKELKQSIAAKKDLQLDGKPWLGHLLALREDFRGVDSVEAYVRELKLDEQIAAHEKAAGKIGQAWYSSKPEKDIFESVVNEIGRSFLCEALPAELIEKMKAWEADAKKLGISKKALAKYSEFESYARGWSEGAKEYESIWSDWKGVR
jgi:predicted esterase